MNLHLRLSQVPGVMIPPLDLRCCRMDRKLCWRQMMDPNMEGDGLLVWVELRAGAEVEWEEAEEAEVAEETIRQRADQGATTRHHRQVVLLPRTRRLQLLLSPAVCCWSQQDSRQPQVSSVGGSGGRYRKFKTLEESRVRDEPCIAALTAAEALANGLGAIVLRSLGSRFFAFGVQHHKTARAFPRRGCRKT